jgi:phosphatidylglycerophosphate synthase
VARTPADRPDLAPDIEVFLRLRQLHAAGYSPSAWARFAVTVATEARATARAAPGLLRSYRRFALGGVLGTLIATAGVGWAVATPVVLLFAVTSLAWWGLLMAVLYLHLGLMAEVDTGRLLPSLGLPNALTVLRAFSVIWVLWAILYSTTGTFWPLAVVFGVAMATDVADGFLARRAHRVTRWGRLYDPLVDGLFFAPAAAGLAVRGIFPEWLAALVLFRYAFPIVGAVLFLLVRRRSLKVRHTPWGQASTAAIGGAALLAAVLLGLGGPWSVVAPGIYAAVAVAMVLALLSIVKRGLEQA